MKRFYDAVNGLTRRNKCRCTWISDREKRADRTAQEDQDIDAAVRVPGKPLAASLRATYRC